MGPAVLSEGMVRRNVGYICLSENKFDVDSAETWGI